jgi:hypothetical protein
MATYTQRPRKDGTVAILVQIVRTIDGKRYTESKAFDKRKTAEAWAKNREAKIEREIAAGKAPKKRSARRVTLGDAIDKYIQESMAEVGKTKAQVLRTIRDEYKISEMACEAITAPDIVAFVKELHKRPDLSSAGTALNYLSHLAAIFCIARPMWGFALDAGAMNDARTVCSKMGLTAKSGKRERCPTLAEMDALMTYFTDTSAADP